MILLLRLLITGIALFLFVITYLQDFDDRRNTLTYKLYLFLAISYYNAPLHEQVPRRAPATQQFYTIIPSL